MEDFCYYIIWNRYGWYGSNLFKRISSSFGYHDRVPCITTPAPYTLHSISSMETASGTWVQTKPPLIPKEVLFFLILVGFYSAVFHFPQQILQELVLPSIPYAKKTSPWFGLSRNISGTWKYAFIFLINQWCRICTCRWLNENVIVIHVSIAGLVSRI